MRTILFAVMLAAGLALSACGAADRYPTLPGTPVHASGSTTGDAVSNPLYQGGKN